MVKCVHCGSNDMELWGLAGSLKGDVKADGASLVCKSCGTMQPDSVLRELLQKKLRKQTEQQNQPVAQAQQGPQQPQQTAAQTTEQQPAQEQSPAQQ